MVKRHQQVLNRLLIVALLLWGAEASAQVSWPNEPAGSTVLSDWGWDSCPGGGWDLAFGCGIITSDGTAPFSPSNVMRYTYNPSTGVGGGDPFLLTNYVDEWYIGLWVWMDPDFVGTASQLNKIFCFTFLNQDRFWFEAGSDVSTSGPFTPRWSLSSFNGINNCHLNSGYGDCPGTYILYGQNNQTITKGVWHRMEVYAKRSSTQTTDDGILRWWMDGVQIGNFTAVHFPGQLESISITPAWAGPSEPHWTHPSEWRFDHVRVSVQNCGGGGCPQPTPDWPNEPTGTTELLDFAFNVTQGSGLDDVNETGVIVSDSTAPLSPVNVFRSRLQNGIAPGGVELRYDLPDLTEMFSGVWWKPNTTFQGLQSGFNRLMGFQQAESPAYLAWVGAQNLSGLSGSIQFYMPLGATAMNNCHLTGWQGNCPGEGRLLPNMSSCTINATDDDWHRIELYVRRSSDTNNRTGIVRWWVDGNLCGNYDPQAGTGVNWGPSGLDYWFWTESWATVPAGQSADWIHYLDHLYLSRPQGATSVDVMPPGPVTSFTVTIPGGPPPPDPPTVGVSPGAEWLQFF